MRLPRWLRGLSSLSLAAVFALVASGQSGLLAGTPPTDLGVRDGRLKPPSLAPNSVSSQAALHVSRPHAVAAAIAPLPAVDGDPRATLRRIRSLLEGPTAVLPGARIVEARDDYLRVEFRTFWLGFVDDAEFWADPATGVVQLRSASRLGEGDMGANRARIEKLRQQLAAAS